MKDGILNVYKDKGYTSHDVVAIVKKITRKKCGHTGTLDPDATGVLPICLGRATRLADYIMADEKEYIADVIFGAETDTQDASGKVIEKVNFSFSEEQFGVALASFIGEYSQIPPMYSAKKQNGKKLYELARSGAEVVREPRLVHIFHIKVLEKNLPYRVKIKVRCSKGTYIRTLCSDLGKRLGGFAHMGSLIRTRSGNFNIENSITIEEIRRLAETGTLDELVIPMVNALSFTKATVSEKCEKAMYNGTALKIIDVVIDREPANGETVLMLNNEGVLVGLYEYSQARFKAKAIVYQDPSLPPS